MFHQLDPQWSKPLAEAARDRGVPVWTSTPPTKPGWYWWKQYDDQDCDRTIRMVGEWPGGGLCVVDHRRSDHSDGITTPELIGGQWYGPLVPPD